MHYTLLLALAALSHAQSYVAPASSAAVSTPVYSTALPSATSESCAAQEDACRTAPNANQSYCSAERCACDGVPAYCHQSASSTVTAPPAYTSAVLSCQAQENACRSAPGANEAYCSAERCACDGVPAYCHQSASSTVTAPPAYTSAVLSCQAQENACRSAPGANEAYCSAQRCACDGVPAYCHPSSSLAPTYTPSTTAPATSTTATSSCQAQENACRSAPGGNEAYCSAQRCACDGVPAYCHESSSPAASTPATYVPASSGLTSIKTHHTKTKAGVAMGTGVPQPSSSLTPYIPNGAAGLRVGADAVVIALIGAVLV